VAIVCPLYGIDAPKPMVRREAKEVHPHEHGSVESFEVGSTGTQTQVSDKIYPKERPYRPPEQTCNDDFLMGEEDTNLCVNTTFHRKILDEGMCQRAAELAGAGIEHNFFVISEDYLDMHPQGCFKWRCELHDQSSTNASVCYYYNPNGDAPGDPKGFPVCYRAEYLNGTDDTNGECDEGFQNVMDEDLCRDAAECLGYADEPEFRVGEWNWSKHDEYPKGCFIRKDTGAFQFNNISSLGGAEPAHPKIGGGTPICNVTHKVNWR